MPAARRGYDHYVLFHDDHRGYDINIIDHDERADNHAVHAADDHDYYDASRYHHNFVYLVIDHDKFHHRSLNDDLHAAAYHHVYDDDYVASDDHLDYHYPAPDDHNGGDDINDHHVHYDPADYDFNDDPSVHDHVQRAIDHYIDHGPGEHDYGPQFNDDDRPGHHYHGPAVLDFIHGRTDNDDYDTGDIDYHVDIHDDYHDAP